MITFKCSIKSVLFAGFLFLPSSQHCIDKSDIGIGIAISGVSCGLLYLGYVAHQQSEKIAKLTQADQILLLSQSNLLKKVETLDEESKSEKEKFKKLQEEVAQLKEAKLQKKIEENAALAKEIPQVQEMKKKVEPAAVILKRKTLFERIVETASDFLKHK